MYYLIGEEFDRDPFLLFAFAAARGKKSSASLLQLSPRRTRENDAASTAERSLRRSHIERPGSAAVPVERPPVNAWLLRRAGPFRFAAASRRSFALGRLKAAESAATLSRDLAQKLVLARPYHAASGTKVQ